MSARVWLFVVSAACFAALYLPTAAATASSLVPPQHRGRALAIVLGGASVATVVGGQVVYAGP